MNFARRDVPALVVALAVPLAVGALAGSVTAPAIEGWYAGLAKPSFTPPGRVFGPVWTVLYAAMGVASWLVWRRRRQGGREGDPRLVRRATRALTLYGLQLLANGAWSLLFFGWRSPLAGLVDLALLLPLVAVTAWLFYRLSRWAGALMAPYVGWVAFAAVLNAAIWRLNP